MSQAPLGVASMPLPSSGGIILGQTCGLLERLDHITGLGYLEVVARQQAARAAQLRRQIGAAPDAQPLPLAPVSEILAEISERVEKERQMPLLEIEPNTELPPLSLLDPPQTSGKGLST